MVKLKEYPFYIRSWLEGNARTHPDEMRHAATIAVWARWTFALGCIVLLAYRPNHETYPYALLASLLIVFVGFNAGLHGAILLRKTITWRWMFAASATDAILISGVIVVGGGFQHFFFVAYYPALALIAVASTSIAVWVIWTTLVAMLYSIISIYAGEGLDLNLRDEKTLFARILAMYIVVITVNLISRIERMRRRAAVRSERILFEERMDVSRTIHDTTAQSAYMVSLGIESALDLADKSNPRLMSTLEATLALAKSAMWELRRPLNMGGIFEGKMISDVLSTHIRTFTAITSVPAKLQQAGDEPRLDVETRSVLFLIAHNALTNAFRHAEASNVTVGLVFLRGRIELTVVDDGKGLPEDFEERGHGISNMRLDAERIGGSLSVESRDAGGGTSVICHVPKQRALEGD